MASDLVLCSTQTILIWLLILSNILVDVKAQVHFSCSMSNYTEGSKYQTNLNRLLYRSLYNNGGNSIYTKASEGEEPDKVYGVFLCRGDVAPKACQKCIDIASEQIPREWPLSKQAGVWYDECLVRYSNVSFAAALDVTVYLVSHRLGNVSRPEQFKGNLSAMFDNLITQATTVNSNLKYAGTNSDEISPFQRLYGMVQCLPDLSAVDCRACLKNAFSEIGNLSLSDAEVPVSGRVLFASCNVRHELFPFLINASATGQKALPPSTSQWNEDQGENTSKTKLISIIISVIALMAVVLGGACFHLVKTRTRIEKEGNVKSQEIHLLNMIGETLDENDDFGSEKQGSSRELPVVKLDLIRVATQNFSEENKVGEGGFGPVYKGTLTNGIAIAIKRLSRTSGQGLKEFKNEVVLIARLQHRNLVRLLGCCLEGNEALLIYEFMPNKSLDFFLFDSRENEILDWRQRLHIIKGIAKGILYLHEDSRLRIIHRDLKASNVLLDKDMNPKISDFGMAKMFSGNQREANTNRVVGT